MRSALFLSLNIVVDVSFRRLSRSNYYLIYLVFLTENPTPSTNLYVTCERVLGFPGRFNNETVQMKYKEYIYIYIYI